MQLDILRHKLADLQGDTAELWQRDAHPELASQKRKVKDRIAELEAALL